MFTCIHTDTRAHARAHPCTPAYTPILTSPYAPLVYIILYHSIPYYLYIYIYI